MIMVFCCLNGGPSDLPLTGADTPDLLPLTTHVFVLAAEVTQLSTGVRC